MDFQSSQSSQTKPYVLICPSQFMHCGRKLNSGLFFLLYNKPSPSFSPLNFLYITWSSAESIIYKKEPITFFSWPLYLQGIWSIHRKSPHFLNSSFWKSKVKKCGGQWSHLFSFFGYLSPLLILLFFVLYSLGFEFLQEIHMCFIKYGSCPHVKLLTNKLSIALQEWLNGCYSVWGPVLFWVGI